MFDAKNFAARLRELREAAGLTQMDVAIRAGMSPSGYTALEQARFARTGPSFGVVCRIADALGCSVADFRDKPTAPAEKRPRGRRKKEG